MAWSQRLDPIQREQLLTSIPLLCPRLSWRLQTETTLA